MVEKLRHYRVTGITIKDRMMSKDIREDPELVLLSRWSGHLVRIPFQKPPCWVSWACLAKQIAGHQVSVQPKKVGGGYWEEHCFFGRTDAHSMHN